jgi:ABC-type polysaccharide/polyol phosphate transport system ATPase subunit
MGGPDSGKSTLLAILGGHVFPTEGRVLVRDRVSPLPDVLAKALALTDKPPYGFNLLQATRMLGIDRRLVKPREVEIEDLAQPLRDADGGPADGALARLAVATAVVLPWSVILLDDLRRLDDSFKERIAERVRERLREGAVLVQASREPDLAQELCDEVIVLEGGSIVDRGEGKDAAPRLEAAAAGRESEPFVPGRYLSQDHELHIPPVVPAFNASAALLSATLRTASGSSKRIDADDDVSVEIRLETALPDIEAHCGVGFTPRKGDAAGIRLEVPEPLRFTDPGTYVLVARPAPGALRSGAYKVRADAVVAHPGDGGASVIARDIGRVRISGDEAEAPEPAEPPVTHWDGRPARRAEAEWSIEPE